MVNWAAIGKMLAAGGAALSALGIALPETMMERQLVIATGVFIVAISAYVSNHVNGKNQVKP